MLKILSYNKSLKPLIIHLIFVLIIILLSLSLVPSQQQIISAEAEHQNKSLVYFEAISGDKNLPKKLDRSLNDTAQDMQIVNNQKIEYLVKIHTFYQSNNSRIPTNIYFVNQFLFDSLGNSTSDDQNPDMHLFGNSSNLRNFDQLYLTQLNYTIHLNTSSYREIRSLYGVLQPDLYKRCLCSYTHEEVPSIILPMSQMPSYYNGTDQESDNKFQNWEIRISYQFDSDYLQSISTISDLQTRIDVVTQNIIKHVNSEEIDYSIDIIESVVMHRISSNYNELLNRFQWYTQRLSILFIIAEFFICLFLSASLQKNLSSIKLLNIRGMSEGQIKKHLIFWYVGLPGSMNVIASIGLFTSTIAISEVRYFLISIIMSWTFFFTPMMLYFILRSNFSDKVHSPKTYSTLNKRTIIGYFLLVLTVVQIYRLFIDLSISIIPLVFILAGLLVILFRFLTGIFVENHAPSSPFRKYVFRSFRPRRYLVLLLLLVIILQMNQTTHYQISGSTSNYFADISGDTLGDYELISTNNDPLYDVNLDGIKSVDAWTLVVNYQITILTQDREDVNLVITNGSTYQKFAEVASESKLQRFAAADDKLWSTEPYYSQLVSKDGVDFSIGQNNISVQKSNIELVDENLRLTDLDVPSIYVTTGFLNQHNISLGEITPSETPVISKILIQSEGIADRHAMEKVVLENLESSTITYQIRPSSIQPHDNYGDTLDYYLIGILLLIAISGFLLVDDLDLLLHQVQTKYGASKYITKSSMLQVILVIGLVFVSSAIGMISKIVTRNVSNQYNTLQYYWNIGLLQTLSFYLVGFNLIFVLVFGLISYTRRKF